MSDHILVVGKVNSAVHETYIIETQQKQTIKASLSGKLRYNKIQVLEGDVVEVRLSPYDLSLGQIVRRLNDSEARKLVFE